VAFPRDEAAYLQLALKLNGGPAAGPQPIQLNVSNPILSPAEPVIRRVVFLLPVLFVALGAVGVVAQTPAATPDLKTLIGNLSSLDYPAA
jgi:hypothetical protein